MSLDAVKLASNSERPTKKSGPFFVGDLLHFAKRAPSSAVRDRAPLAMRVL
jgi:hypothetical protein